MDEKVDLVDKDRKDTDNQINYRIWIVQMCIWTMIVFLSKIIIFFFEVMYHKPIIKLGNFLLSGLQGKPELELFIVMVFVPVTLNSIQYWIQDTFLKGDKHIEDRTNKQLEEKRAAENKSHSWFIF